MMTKNTIQKIQYDILPQVLREYQEGYQHVSLWRQEVQEEIRNIKKDIPEGNVYIDLVKENVDFERSVFLNDNTSVRFVSDDGIIGSSQMQNLTKAWRSDMLKTFRKRKTDIYKSRNFIRVLKKKSQINLQSSSTKVEILYVF